jgi:hypothetical protein
VVGAVVAAVAGVPWAVVAAVAGVPWAVIAAVAGVPGTVVAAVADVPRTVVAAVANLGGSTLLMDPMAGLTDVAGRIIGSVPGLRGDRERGRGDHDDCRYRLGGAESHGFLLSGDGLRLTR